MWEIKIGWVIAIIVLVVVGVLAAAFIHAPSSKGTEKMVSSGQWQEATIMVSDKKDESFPYWIDESQYINEVYTIVDDSGTKYKCVNHEIWDSMQIETSYNVLVSGMGVDSELMIEKVVSKTNMHNSKEG